MRPEESFMADLIDLARSLGWRCAHFRPVRALLKNGQMRWMTPVQADGEGWPDLVLVGHGRVLFCELKSDPGVLTTAQEAWLEALRAAAGLLSPAEIRKGREGLGLTQKQLANQLRISEFTLSRWETGAQIQQRSMDAFLRVFFQSGEARRLLGAAEAEQGGSHLGARPAGGEFASQAR